MMFCDKCDRGYHTFCVGLKSIPNGPWKCQSCKGPETPKTPKSVTKRGRQVIMTFRCVSLKGFEFSTFNNISVIS